MESVEGPTLADRIQKGPPPIEEALAIARQIGEPLEAAHEKGTIHRDLKPANIKVKPDGTVKGLGIGLAKKTEAGAVAANAGESPTTPIGATIAGQIVGTAAYMAPEQARGREADKRADNWSFGVVLYEMLAGRLLFAGDTTFDTLVAVLREEPDWSRVSVRARKLLRKYLEKDPKCRLRDGGDAWALLDETAQKPATRVPGNGRPQPGYWRRA
jgi:serine/threonine-protein kinase